MMKRAILLLIFPVLLAAQDDTYPPGTFQMTPKIDLGLSEVPVFVPEKFRGMVSEELTVNLPTGFSARVFAVEGLRGPRFMAWNSEGVLHVANMKAGNADEFEPNGVTSQIVALPDRDGDGVADEAIVAADNLRWANSLAFYQGDMYVADTHQIVKFSDGDGDLVYETREVFADNIPTASTPHLTRTIVVDEARGLFYLSVGSTCDVCREGNPERATVLRFNADGTGRKIFATGLRNAIGLGLHPVTGELWATNNGHTEEAITEPPEWIDIVREDGFYGWPFAFGYQVYIDFNFRGSYRRMLPITTQDSLLVQTMGRPVAQVDAHVAPMDIHFYGEGNFPSNYRHAAFVAYRAGFRGPDPGHKIVAMFVGPDGSDARVGDFMTGFWPNPPDRANTWGTPVGLATDRRGSLYVTSDWINHLVLKVDFATETSVEEEASSLPNRDALRQNYPNPFNSSTSIEFDLASEQDVELGIYNLSGQRVITLVSGVRGVGRHTAHWDGRDRSGRNVASGIYIYRLQAGTDQQIRRLLLLQ
jgi:glucose/arabinose dehydrogenase